MSAPPPHVERDLDLSNAGRGVWLVKVPKYIANKWEKAPGNIEVGKLKITKWVDRRLVRDKRQDHCCHINITL